MTSSAHEVFVLNFHIKNAKVHNLIVHQPLNKEVFNDSNEPLEVPLTFSYPKTHLKTWNTLSPSAAKFTLVSAVPYLVGAGEVEVLIGDVFKGEYEWGKTMTTQSDVNITKNVIVPPKTRLIMKLLVKTAYYDVPFTYIHSLGTKSDGVFTGFNYFDMQFEATQVR